MSIKSVGIRVGGDKERILKTIEDTIGHMDVTIVEWSK